MSLALHLAELIGGVVCLFITGYVAAPLIPVLLVASAILITRVLYAIRELGEGR